jgi:hypothetical protein
MSQRHVDLAQVDGVDVEHVSSFRFDYGGLVTLLW